MTNRETWAKRVAEWKASGLTSAAFARGKPFSSGGLRHWAHRLRRGEQQSDRVRVARVVRLAQGAPARPSAGERAPEVVVEIGPVRVTMPPAFDRATLAVVLNEVLAATRSGR